LLLSLWAPNLVADEVSILNARALLEDTLVWDNHVCMPLRPNDDGFLPQLKRYKDAGVNAVTLNVGFGDQGIEEHVRMLAHFRRWLALHDQEYMLATKPEDIEQACLTGKLAVLFDIEGMNAIADQPSLVQLYYELGVRWMLVAYNQNNAAGGGCQDNDMGLTMFGRQIINEMERVGMVACCSHTGIRTAMDVMSYSSHPVIFSHSNARAVHDHPRNIPDEAMKACAATGGVVGLNGIGIFIGKTDNLVEGLLRHIDHAVQLIGIEHVGLGLDYIFDTEELESLLDNPAMFPPELGYQHGIQMMGPETMEGIVSGMVKLGYSKSDLQAILGANLLRIAKQVWR
jgi:membrane dipeptidase